MARFFGYFIHRLEEGNLTTTTEIPTSQHLLCGAGWINKQHLCLLGKERLEEAAYSHSLPRTPERIWSAMLNFTERPTWPL